jgi:Arc/MetJ-type ribon-helix-helix transcriptional regulator
MAKSPRSASAPLTFDLPLSLIARIESIRRGRTLKSASEAVRLAIEQFDFEGCEPAHDPRRQISVRITPRQRATLKRFSRKKHASVGELLRLALESLPSKPSRKS